ncbi:3-deoxy-7-phosphoheptulonate synthase [Parasphaerochaeta coccoides]|uniref:Bifunctional chorismate mutase/prephenate dehydratase n=1 Tax=Parasphaerochaeta coccoides (strain ATCC BAA-1237 / DSM 17374 / SPN1) TaxID=760011 RepID=F4GLY0_PARC1|nr:3-deoxy-7-phosphoheptulonate synthase [Parasphaerochaeta coccoides]AEC03021.1 phospho-2-dehydro-3-deoxyheptonate aldolase [Parasphaerochaeta coccoides DSM 17374]
MIIVLKKTATDAQKDFIRNFLKKQGFRVKEIVGKEETIIGAVGTARMDLRSVELLEGVASVVPISKPYKLASRELKPDDTIVQVGAVKIGGNRIVMIAGPCAVESREQMLSIGGAVREAGAVILRGGAFKPRSSPYAFQGLGEEGLKYLREAGDAYGMPVVSEIVSTTDVDMMKDYVHMFQIGARNMQNFELLKVVGKTGMPVLLKRGLSATIEEWLMAAEYLMSSGTDGVVLCERGIRTYERATRNTLDVSAIPVIQKLTHLPIIGDPSHATGIRDMVSPVSLAIVAAGASGLTVEVHDHPEKALSDGPQSLYPAQFEKLARDVQALAPVVGKSLERIPRILPSAMESPVDKRSPQGTSVVAYQGVPGAFSELAVYRSFNEDVSVLPSTTFRDVFEAVASGQAAYGVLPVENTLGGTINETLDLLNSYPSLTVVGEQQVRIIHHLIGLPGTRLEDIRKVYSHPQGLAQCVEYLRSHLPHAQAVSFFDTAGAVKFVGEQGDPTLAAIAGAPAASVYGLSVLAESIETNPRNYTRFYIVSREENADVYRSQSQVNRAAMVFSVNDRPGALFHVLEILSRNGLSMKKLESRPIPGKPWEYSFFVETELGEPGAFSVTLEQVREASMSLRVLGLFTAVH